MCRVVKFQISGLLTSSNAITLRVFFLCLTFTCNVPSLLFYAVQLLVLLYLIRSFKTETPRSETLKFGFRDKD